MNGEKISRCLNALPDEMLEEAMSSAVKFRRCNITIRCLRAVACLAVAISLLLAVGMHKPSENGSTGILTITAYAMDSYTAKALEPGTVLPYSYTWSPAINAVPGLPLTLSVSADGYVPEDITFYITVDGGCFLRHQGPANWLDNYHGETKQLPQEFSLSNGSTIYWRCWQQEGNHSVIFEGDTAYVDIIIYEKEDIIGYAVLQICRIYSEEYGRTVSFTASMIVSESFSKGQEPVNEEHVYLLIDGAKK